jgi:drug/metabolite transporter (DMT)-like permease
MSAVSSRDTTARREREGVALSVTAAAGFAAMAVTAKLVYAGGGNVVTLVSLRFGIAAPLLWALAARRGVVRGVSRRDALVPFALGLFLFSFEAGTFFGAVTRIGAALAELIIFTYPVLVVLGAIVLRHEPASRQRLVALAVAMGGIVLVLTGGGAGTLDPIGAGLAFSAAVLYTVYVLAAGRVSGRMHALTFAALLASGTAVATTTAGLASGTLDLAMSASAWGWMVGMAVVSAVIALTAFVGGVARLGPSRAAILALLEPFLACVMVFAAFGERLAPLQLAGGALVLSGALLVQLRPLRSLRRGASARPPAAASARALAHVAADE